MGWIREGRRSAENATEICSQSPSPYFHPLPPPFRRCIHRQHGNLYCIVRKRARRTTHRRYRHRESFLCHLNAARLCDQCLFQHVLLCSLFVRANTCFWSHGLTVHHNDRWPLAIRRICARVYHIGGLHSGFAVSGTIWLVLFAGQATRQLVKNEKV